MAKDRFNPFLLGSQVAQAGIGAFKQGTQIRSQQRQLDTAERLAAISEEERKRKMAWQDELLKLEKEKRDALTKNNKITSPVNEAAAKFDPNNLDSNDKFFLGPDASFAGKKAYLAKIKDPIKQAWFLKELQRLDKEKADKEVKSVVSDVDIELEKAFGLNEKSGIKPISEIEVPKQFKTEEELLQEGLQKNLSKATSESDLAKVFPGINKEDALELTNPQQGFNILSVDTPAVEERLRKEESAFSRFQLANLPESDRNKAILSSLFSPEQINALGKLASTDYNKFSKTARSFVEKAIADRDKQTSSTDAFGFTTVSYDNKPFMQGVVKRADIAEQALLSITKNLGTAQTERDILSGKIKASPTNPYKDTPPSVKKDENGNNIITNDIAAWWGTKGGTTYKQGNDTVVKIDNNKRHEAAVGPLSSYFDEVEELGIKNHKEILDFNARPHTEVAVRNGYKTAMSDTNMDKWIKDAGQTITPELLKQYTMAIIDKESTGGKHVLNMGFVKKKDSNKYLKNVAVGLGQVTLLGNAKWLFDNKINLASLDGQVESVAKLFLNKLRITGGDINEALRRYGDGTSSYSTAINKKVNNKDKSWTYRYEVNDLPNLSENLAKLNNGS